MSRPEEVEAALISTLTSTIEPLDPEDDDPAYAALLLTTLTKSSGDNENDDEDEALLAMTTTLTESSGDNENDPDEGYIAAAGNGQLLPFAFRFAEQERARPLNAAYDPARKIHVLPDGRTVVEVIAAHTKKIY
jgi:hypothetical protein